MFCNQLYVGDSLPGFKSFVIRFMLQMSKVMTSVACNICFDISMQDPVRRTAYKFVSTPSSILEYAYPVHDNSTEDDPSLG